MRLLRLALLIVSKMHWNPAELSTISFELSLNNSCYATKVDMSEVKLIEQLMKM